DEVPDTLQSVFDELIRGHFFLPSSFDEAVNLKERYEHCRRNSPFYVTITTTMDCNLGCYYCYEDKSKSYLARSTCDQIINWIDQQFAAKEHQKLYTDWYGGEPMLNQEAIDYFSRRIIPSCDDRGILYSSAMISNGTLWPEDARGFVERN